MNSKPGVISAGPSSNDDRVLIDENDASSGILIIDVLANDARRASLYSLDDGQVADLLNPDQLLVADHSRLGAAIWITAAGKVGYAIDAARVQSLAVGETLEDSFLYAARLPNGSLVWSTVRVTITGANDAPVATWDAAAVAEDSLASGSVAANDTDADHGALLSYGATGPLPAGFALAGDGSWALDGSDPAYQALGEGETLQVTVPYIVTDEHGATSSATLVLTVTGANDAPVTTSAFAAVAEDGSTSGQLVALDQDEGAQLTYALTGGVPAGFSLAAEGSWSFDASGDAYQALAAGAFQIVEVPFAVTDEHGATASSTLLIAVNGTNDAPDAQDVVADLQLTRWEERETLTGTVAATDPDAGSTLTYFAFGLPGFAMNSDGSWRYEPSTYDTVPLAEGEVLPTYVQYQVTDEHGATDTAILYLNLIGANDAPMASPLYVDATEDQAASGVYAALDVDHGAVLTYAVQGDAVAGFTLNSDGSWTLDTAHPAFRWLAEGQSISFGIGIRATDEFGASSSSGIGFTVTGVNDAAIIDGQRSGSVTEAGTAGPGTPQRSGQLTITDWDGPSSFAPITGQASFGGYGTYSVTAGGAWTYVLDNANPAVNQLNGGQSLTDSFVVTAADGTTASVTITIAGARDFTAPVAYTGTGDPVDNNLTTGNGSGVTTYTGTEGADAIIGSWFSDFIDARGGDDTLLGGDGNDQILAGLGNDSVYGGAGGDVLSGMGGDDQIWGGSGNDDIAGQDGNDLLYGGSNWDVISGGAGADIITGGFGFDELYGGAGFDWFDFNDLRDTNDVIYDFQYGETLDFRNIDANPLLAGDQAFGWSAAGPAGHSLWAEQQGANWTIYGDTDGDLTTAEFMVTLQNAGSNFGPNYPGLFL